MWFGSGLMGDLREKGGQKGGELGTSLHLYYVGKKTYGVLEHIMLMDKVENREKEEKLRGRVEGGIADFLRCMCIGQQTSPPL